MINFPAAIGGLFVRGGRGNCKGVFFLGGKGEVMWGQFFRGVIGGWQYTHTNALTFGGGGEVISLFLGGRGDIG